MAKVKPTLLSSAVGILSGSRSGSNSFASGCLPLCIRNQAAFVEEPLNVHNVVLEHFLCHLHPVDLDIVREDLSPLHGVLVNCPILADDEGHHHCLHNFLLSSVSGGPLAVFLIFLSEGLVHIF